MFLLIISILKQTSLDVYKRQLSYKIKMINIRELEKDDAKDLEKWLSNPVVLEYYDCLLYTSRCV